jgi:hypothetical protein
MAALAVMGLITLSEARKHFLSSTSSNYGSLGDYYTSILDCELLSSEGVLSDIDPMAILSSSILAFVSNSSVLIPNFNNISYI